MFRSSAGIERFALLGISQGAPIAVAYAVRQPERVTHLVLHGGYARGRYHRGLQGRAIEEVDLTIRLAEIGWGQENAAFRQFFAAGRTLAELDKTAERTQRR